MYGLLERINWTPSTRTVGGLPDGTPYPEGLEVWTVADPDGDASYLDQVTEDGAYLFPERRADYRAGRFAFVGIVARAPCPCCGSWRYSPGVWGIEDDSGGEYFREVADEEVVQLALIMER